MIVILSDLDGTLLDADHYSFSAAGEALREIERRRIPLVLASSKTRAEMEEIRLDFGNSHPFISENGGAVYIPEEYFPFSIPESRERDGFLVIELGTAYDRLCDFLDRAAGEAGIPVKGFHSLEAAEISRLTGLDPNDAARAKRREYDEPFLFKGSPEQWKTLEKQARSDGLTLTRGGRFPHVTGANDKGRAARILIYCYRRQNPDIRTVGIGDSLNDVPLLKTVNHAFLVQKPDGSYDPGVDLPNLKKSPAPGPSGWNQSILEIIREYYQ